MEMETKIRCVVGLGDISYDYMLCLVVLNISVLLQLIICGHYFKIVSFMLQRQEDEGYEG